MQAVDFGMPSDKFVIVFYLSAGNASRLAQAATLESCASTQQFNGRLGKPQSSGSYFPGKTYAILASDSELCVGYQRPPGRRHDAREESLNIPGVCLCARSAEIPNCERLVYGSRV